MRAYMKICDFLAPSHSFSPLLAFSLSLSHSLSIFLSISVPLSPPISISLYPLSPSPFRAMVRLGVDLKNPTGTDWSELMLDSQSVAVDSRIACSGGVLWGVRDNGQLVVRQGISTDKPTGDSWHLMRVNNVRECHVGRSLDIGWVVDTAGIVYFQLRLVTTPPPQSGVTQTKPHGTNLWWHVSASEHVGTGPGTTASLAGWFGARRRSETKQVATSTEGGVWLLCGDSTLCRRYGNITGHNWASVLRSSLGNTGQRLRWTGLVAQGAYPDKTSPVWAINGDGELLCLTRSCEPRHLEIPEVKLNSKVYCGDSLCGRDVRCVMGIGHQRKDSGASWNF
eukprot:sb/3466494/